jgi:hypothetical protein
MEIIFIAVFSVTSIYLLFAYPFATIGGAIFLTIMIMVNKEKKKNKEALEEKQKELEARNKELAAQQIRKLSEQQSIHSQLFCNINMASRAFEKLPKYILEAESYLDKSEEYFKEGAFSPFWESIEMATIQLGHFNQSLDTILFHIKQGDDLIKVLDSKPPNFPIRVESIHRLGVVNATTDRLKSIVRIAHLNFQFSIIYEQRRTSMILIEGFQNLGDAIEGMGLRIISSIEDLGREVSEMSASINTSLSTINSSVREINSTIQLEAANQAERHQIALTMLDNIQHRRLPKKNTSKEKDISKRKWY